MATETKRTLQAEIGHRRNGQDITRGYVDALPLLPNVDQVLAQAGGWRGYDEILRDDQVGAAFDQRRLALIARPWQVDAGGDSRLDRKAADLVRATLEHVEWDRITDAMLYARFYGFGVAEILWAPDGAGLGISGIAVRDRARFGFAPDNSLRLRTSSQPNGIELPDRKFWVVSVGATSTDDPYGRGIAHRLYWPVFFKRQGARFWSIFLEKFGGPTAVGKFAAGEDPANVTKLLDAATAVQTAAAVAIPENMTLDLIEASRGGTASYPEWMFFWNDSITKVVLGQTASLQGTPGRLGKDDLQHTVLENILRADADLICQSANASWVQWLVDLNFPGAAYPTIWREMDDQEDLGNRSDRDTKLFAMGFRLTRDALKRIYGDDYEAAPTPPPLPADGAPGQPPAAPSGTPPTTAASRMESEHGVRLAGPAQPAPQALADRAAAETQDAWTNIVDHIRTLVEQAGSLAELRDALLNAYGNLPTDRLTSIMALGFETANLAGRLDARADSHA